LGRNKWGVVSHELGQGSFTRGIRGNEANTYTYLAIHLREGKKEHTQQMEHI